MSPQANKIVDGLTKVAIAVLTAGSLAAFAKFNSLDVYVAESRVLQKTMKEQLMGLDAKVDRLGTRQQEILIELARITGNPPKED